MGVRTFSILVTVFFAIGCSRVEGLLTLKRLGDSQEQMQRSVDKQKAYLLKLIKDIKEDKLTPGSSIDDIERRYGEPVLVKEGQEMSSIKVFLYREPTNYFESDKVYLYFNKEEKLTKWEYKPYKKQN